MGCWQSQVVEGKCACRAQVLVKDCELKLMEGDLSNVCSDAIINSTNETLSLESPDSKSLYSRGGPSIRTNSIQYINTHGPVSIGSTVTTTPGDLPCQHLIHVVAPIYVNGRRGEKEALQKAVWKVMETVEELKCKSVSLPAIGTQLYAYPKAECVEIMVETVKRYVESRESCIDLVHFISADKLTVRCFHKALSQLK